MSNLTTLVRFKQYAGITGTSQDALITALLPQVSGAIERYLRRTLETTTYKSWLDGSGSPILRLNQYPILAIYYVAISSVTVGYIKNTSSSVIRASVSFDGTNLSLTEISTTGTVKTTDLPVSTSKIMSALKTAIEVVSGWECTLNSSDYDSEPTAFLRPMYGQDALSESVADLVVADDPVSVKVVNEDLIELGRSPTFPTFNPQATTVPLETERGFPSGTANVFVWFKAGYSMPSDAVGEIPASDGTLPTGLALIVHQILQDVLSSTKFNSNVQSEGLGDYNYSLRATTDGAVASAVENRKRDLAQYRRVSI